MSASLKGKNENNLIGSQLDDQGCVNRYRLLSFCNHPAYTHPSPWQALGFDSRYHLPSPPFPSAYLVFKKILNFPYRLSVKNCKEGLKH